MNETRTNRVVKKWGLALMDAGINLYDNEVHRIDCDELVKPTEGWNINSFRAFRDFLCFV